MSLHSLNFSAGLNSGDLDRRIKFQSPNTAQDATGDPVKTWTDVPLPGAPDGLHTWARYEPLAVREPFTEGQFAAFADCRFYLRYRPDVTIVPTWRIVDDHGRLYEILGVDEVRRREILEIKAYARTEAG